MHRSRSVRDYVLSREMGTVCRSILGERVYLFHEQFIIKCPHESSSVLWHQDSEDGIAALKEYIICWLPLDDVSIENGSLVVSPFRSADDRKLRIHRSGSMVEPPLLESQVGISAFAGSLIIMSSPIPHMSTPNITLRPRRVHAAYYSSDAVEGSFPCRWK